MTPSGTPSGTSSLAEVTGLLLAWRAGDASALERLIPLVHAELRRIAHRFMRKERAGHSLQTSALVNEAYLRLIDAHNVDWQNRAHFFAISASLMRRILVDFARARQKLKRGGPAQQVSLDEALIVTQARGTDLVALDDALTALSQLDPRQSKVVELRFFGGLTRRRDCRGVGSYFTHCADGLEHGQGVVAARIE